MPKIADIKKVLVIGSGPIIIGQAAEFDYAGTQACRALREDGIEVVLVNSNPATIMTDTDIADKVYIEPLTVPVIRNIIKRERPDSMLATLGGQTGLNLAMELAESGVLAEFGVKLLGTDAESIHKAEDREAFKTLMDDIGEPIIESVIANTYEQALNFANTHGYPGHYPARVYARRHGRRHCGERSGAARDHDERSAGEPRARGARGKERRGLQGD